MAQQTIGIGAAANDGTGDKLRDAFDKANDNFTELYAEIAGLGSGAGVDVDTDGTLAADSDAKVASQKAVVTYVAAQIAAAVTGLLDLKGSTDCSANPNYPAASKGDAYVVSVAGKIGGASGTSVSVGDVYFAKADNAGGTQASVGASWDTIIHSGSLSGALLAANNLSDIGSTSTALDNLGFTANAKSLVTAANYAAMRTLLGLVIGTNVQAQSTKLDAIAANTVTTDTTTARTAALADADTFIRFTNSSAVTFTIPPNSSVAFPVGTVIEFSQSGAGAVSVAPGSGVTINSRSSDLTLAGQYAVAFVKKVATDTWILNGDL